MQRAEFDKFAAEYRQVHADNIKASGEEPEYFSAYKARDLSRELTRRQIPGPRILDFGSGIGSLVPFVRQHIPDASIVCVDVSQQSLDYGAAAHGAAATFVGYDGRTLPFIDDSFDAVIAACVFHHIDGSKHLAHLQDVRRVLRPGGLAMVYEHNPWNPLTRRAVDSCPLDENAVLISGPDMQGRVVAAGFRDCRLAYRVFFPSVLRAIRPLEDLMRWLAIGAQYYVTGVK